MLRPVCGCPAGVRLDIGARGMQKIRRRCSGLPPATCFSSFSRTSVSWCRSRRRNSPGIWGAHVGLICEGSDSRNNTTEQNWHHSQSLDGTDDRLCLVFVCRGRYGLGGVVLLFILGSNLGGVGPVRGLRGGGRGGWCEEWARSG
jgi:hypothetical protein